MTTQDTAGRPAYIVVGAEAPAAYWGGWAEEVSRFCPCPGSPIMLRTIRKGRDGESDARYIADRLASGMHYAEWSHTLEGAEESIVRMAARARHEESREANDLCQRLYPDARRTLDELGAGSARRTQYHATAAPLVKDDDRPGVAEGREWSY